MERRLSVSAALHFLAELKSINNASKNRRKHIYAAFNSHFVNNSNFF